MPAVIPKSANNVPAAAASNLIVPVPAVESPNDRPLWNISRFPVVLLTLAVTPPAFAELIADATSDNAVPPVVTSIPLICIL